MTTEIAATTSFENIDGINSLLEFFQKRGLTYDKADGSLKITPHHTMKLILVDEIAEDMVEQKRKQLLDDKIARFGLLVDTKFQRFKFIRPKERPNTFTYDKTKSYSFERRQSALKLVDAIAYSPEPYNESILNLFDVKELVDRFYRSYQSIRNGLAKEIHGVKNGVSQLFAQVLLDRVIFVYFLQAKGILPKDYLHALYEQAVDKHDSFHDIYLKPLFFELLNSSDVEKKEEYRRTFGQVDIPYLNGGLFRKREFETDGVAIHNKAWKPIFELFDGYEWVIEDTESGGLTPEILGHIFEMSMTEGERKTSGAYYTPKEVTSFICKEAIGNYLCESVRWKFSRQFSSIDEILLTKNREILEFAYQKLRRIRILDPAVGSGAFLIAAQDFLIDYLMQLYEELDKLDSHLIVEDKNAIATSGNSLSYHLKKQMMTQNLYGVDINPGGVEICKLRLWLSMITTAKKVEPLPNIEFNIRHGNSLIGFVEVTGDVGDSATLDDPERPPQSIKSTFMKRNELIQKYRQERDTLNAERLKSQIAEYTLKFKHDLERKLTVKLGRNLKELYSKPWFIPFHWVMEFSDVLNDGGFDIVIGNPPYVELPQIEYGPLLTEARNLYDAFIRLSIHLLAPEGWLGFIHANSAYCQPKYQSLREFLRRNAENLQIINFAIRPQPIFRGVMQRTAITICRKHGNDCKNVKTSRYLRLTQDTRNGTLAAPPTHDCTEFAWRFRDFVPKIGNSYDHSIFSKLISNPTTLQDILDDENGRPLVCHDSGESYWTKILDHEPRGIRNGKKVAPSHWFEVRVKEKLADFTICLINGTLFYWYWLTTSDCRDLTWGTLTRMPVPSENQLDPETVKSLRTLASQLMKCYEENSTFVEKRPGYKSLEFKVNRCKPLINEIDRVVGKLFGLSNEEVQYLIDYDKQMRTEHD